MRREAASLKSACLVFNQEQEDSGWPISRGRQRSGSREERLPQIRHMPPGDMENRIIYLGSAAISRKRNGQGGERSLEERRNTDVLPGRVILLKDGSGGLQEQDKTQEDLGKDWTAEKNQSVSLVGLPNGSSQSRKPAVPVREERCRGLPARRFRRRPADRITCVSHRKGRRRLREKPKQGGFMITV